MKQVHWEKLNPIANIGHIQLNFSDTHFPPYLFTTQQIFPKSTCSFKSGIHI